HRLLRNIYKRGPLHSVEVLLTAESFGELINRYKYLFLIARHDRQLVRDVAVLETQLTTRERQLERTLLALEDSRTDQALRADRLAEVPIARERAIAAVQASGEIT